MRGKWLELPAYLLVLILVLFPLLDTVLTFLPLRVGDVAWRFGAVGLLSRALLTPLLGLFLASAIAVLFDRPRVVLGLSVLSACAALCLLIIVPLFVLDIIEMRARMPENTKRAFDVASLVALLKYAAMFLALGLLALRGWKAARRSAREARPVAPSKLVFARPDTSETT